MSARITSVRRLGESRFSIAVIVTPKIIIAPSMVRVFAINSPVIAMQESVTTSSLIFSTVGLTERRFSNQRRAVVVPIAYGQGLRISAATCVRSDVFSAFDLLSRSSLYRQLFGFTTASVDWIAARADEIARNLCWHCWPLLGTVRTFAGAPEVL